MDDKGELLYVRKLVGVSRGTMATPAVQDASTQTMDRDKQQQQEDRAEGRRRDAETNDSDATDLLTPKDKEETSEDSVTDPEEGKETDTEEEREEPGEDADWEWKIDYNDWDYVRDYRVKASELGPSQPCKWRKGRSYTPDGWKRRYKYRKVKKTTTVPTVDPTDCLFEF